MRLLLLPLLAFLCLAIPARAEEPTLQERIAEQVAKTKKKRFVTFNVENDLFGGGSDQNYTSGVRATYFDLGAQPHPLFKNISRVFPTFTINKTTSIHYTVGQNLYTPKDITQVVQDPND
ncbi:MAG: lipid A-modifier LpxR family protein, partial [Alphaproteobacteria bacterium]